MQETPNLKLKKPDLTDYVNIMDLNDNADAIDAHAGEAATTLKVGHVQLSSAVTSTDDTKAATPAAVKKVNDALTTHSADDAVHVQPGEREKWNGKQDSLPQENRRRITFGVTEPTGGVDGDIYFQYE